MIEVDDYNPDWNNKYEMLKLKIWPIIKNIAERMEHVGSTSVVGLAAKPIVDVDIVIASMDKLPLIVAALAGIGYQHIGNLGIVGRDMFKQEKPEFRHNSKC